MNEVVDKYGVCWVAAGGNHGPALCTIGTPPNISSNNIIGQFIFLFIYLEYEVLFSLNLKIFLLLLCLYLRGGSVCITGNDGSRVFSKEEISRTTLHLDVPWPYHRWSPWNMRLCPWGSNYICPPVYSSPCSAFKWN